jgi:hypothetical protein
MRRRSLEDPASGAGNSRRHDREEKAKGGSQQHAKFLFDWAKLDPTFPSEEEESGPSLAQILLDKLREDTSESASASTTEVL